MTDGPTGDGAGEDFSCSLRFGADAEKVFDAIARAGGDNGWWTTSGDVAKEEGDLIRLDWRGGDFIAFRVDRLDRPRAMAWTCVDQRDRNLPRPDEWVGTSLRFQVRPSENGTILDFTHVGLSAELDCFDICEPGWDFFLRRSLHPLVEKCEGMPFDARGD